MINHSRLKVALFGGSFDPPHQGHQEIVRKALETLEIDCLIIVPAYLNPFKESSLASANTRLEWCRTLFEGVPHVIVDDYEIQQAKSIRTSQTVKHFSIQYDVEYLIIGSDNLATLTAWHAFEWLNKTITWVIATRKEHLLDTQKLRAWKILEMHHPVSSTYIRKERDLHYIDNKIKHLVSKTLKENTTMTIDERIENIVTILDEKKAEEIEVFNLEKADYIAKYVIIANSLNGKHTVALFEHLKRDLKPLGETFLATDVSDDWVVADLGDILIHIMVPAYRQRYSLESFLGELVEKQKKETLS